ncbi:hypothetical protein NONO_c28770 [Nocardia nova SH22a]|uniref:Uncharacterized protein n=1 Tax=Nocardia nova SH22a TaxID=1415166 RepID=W5TEK5_9NOCA|nr:hypothetical protein NONO_c28770 [Nocardia nova SH22a]
MFEILRVGAALTLAMTVSNQSDPHRCGNIVRKPLTGSQGRGRYFNRPTLRIAACGSPRRERRKLHNSIQRLDEHSTFIGRSFQYYLIEFDRVGGV